MARSMLASLCVCLLAAGAVTGDDLARVYKATIDHDPDALGREWTSGSEDVWKLTRFRYRIGKFRIESGPGTVVFGRHGTNVVWAAFLPDAPGQVSHPDIGEASVASLWMRFNPRMVGKLFPRQTVRGNGPVRRLLDGLRVYQHKIDACHELENTPCVPECRFVVLDIDTGDGDRHAFEVDTRKREVRYQGAFRNRPVPPPPDREISSEDAPAAFDAAWRAFDEHYAKFGLRPEVEWAALRDLYRPVAERARTAYEAAGAIALLTLPLRDLHVRVEVDGVRLPGYRRCRMLNACWKTSRRLVPVRQEDPDLGWGRTEDGIGFITIDRLTDRKVVAKLDRALGALGDTWALVVDLRFDEGGKEDIARSIAGRFLAEPRIYALHRYRTGPGHDELGPKLERRVSPRGPWRYEAPLVVLQGRKTAGAAESLVRMLARGPDVTTIGDHTAGSTGRAKRVDLPGQIAVDVPRRLDLTVDGEPIDEVGIAPDVLVETRRRTFRGADPVMEEALRRLREIPEESRRPGKR